MKKTALKKSGTIKKSSIKKTKTKKTDAYDKEFAEIRPKVLERDEYICQANLSGCTRIATHVHHKQLRSQRGPNTFANLVSLDEHCHQYIHSHPMWAKTYHWIL